MMGARTIAGSLNSARFGQALLGALAHPYTVEQARELMRSRVKGRVDHFLSLCESAIYANPHSPYRPLLQGAGYTWERLSAFVRARGLEAALTQLATDGVYLDIEEFKGKKPIVRRGQTLRLAESDLDMVTGPSVFLQSSGSRGPAMRTPIGVEGLKLQACYLPLVMDVLQARDLPVVLYYPMPSTAGIVHLIVFTLAGTPPAAWFSQVAVAPWWQSAVGWKLATLLATARLQGVHLPMPRPSDIHHPITLARWIQARCPQGALIATFPGSALRLLQAARSENLELPPLTFALGGEPVTKRKRGALEEAGHRVFPWFGTVETGRIAVGCLQPAAADDMHLLADRLSAIVRSRIVDASGTERGALLFTSVLTGARKMLLNVETGDEGLLEIHRCGCPWEALGLLLHVHSVQSFEKLTLEGMTFVVNALAHLAEEILPAQCGGTPADYQFAEEESRDGLTRLVVSVSPTVSAEEDLIRRTVLESLRASGPAATRMTDLLARAAAVTVRREHPRLTGSGKILTLRTHQRGNKQ